MACAPGVTVREISARCKPIAAVLQRGRMRPAGPLGWADGAEDVGRAGALIVRRRGSRPPPCPAACDLVLLADPGFVLEPHLYRLAGRVALGDLGEALGEIF